MADREYILSRTLDVLKESVALLKEQEGMIKELQNAYGYLQKKFFEAQDKLLKEQGAVVPNVSSTEQRCGNCNKIIEMDGWIACPWCGKPIAWNEWWNKNARD